MVRTMPSSGGGPTALTAPRHNSRHTAPSSTPPLAANNDINKGSSTSGLHHHHHHHSSSIKGHGHIHSHFNNNNNNKNSNNHHHTHHRKAPALPPWITDTGSDDGVGLMPESGADYAKFTDPALPCSLRLHNEIVSLLKWLTPTEHETHVRLTIQYDMQRVLQSVDAAATVDIFGSFSTGTGLPSSDVDLNVVTDALSSIEALADLLRPADKFSHIIVIARARVPVVKCRHRATAIEVDITLNNVSGRLTGISAKQLLDRFPAARPLLIVVKLFLRQRGLTCVNFGGLSSYSLCLMVVRYIQQRPDGSQYGYGELLVDFFRFYGEHFNYQHLGIDVANDRFVEKPHPTQPPYLLLAIDPTDRDNNVAASSKRIRYVQMAFLHAYHALTVVDYPAAVTNDGIHVPSPPTLLTRIIHVDAHIQAIRRHLARCPRMTQHGLAKAEGADGASGSPVEDPLARYFHSWVRQIDTTPFLPEIRPTFLASPTLSFAAAVSVVSGAGRKTIFASPAPFGLKSDPGGLDEFTSRHTPPTPTLLPETGLSCPSPLLPSSVVAPTNKSSNNNGSKTATPKRRKKTSTASSVLRDPMASSSDDDDDDDDDGGYGEETKDVELIGGPNHKSVRNQQHHSHSKGSASHTLSTSKAACVKRQRQ
eukprot:PhM_4_TR15698/c0_g1_i1/m.54565/K03514/PAPD5_7, TRF4; non-canonical poly(A) RNA polymerase PAPD5/7